MTRPYSNDLRERVVCAHLDGEPIRAVAARLGVSVSSVPKWTARYRATGSVAPGQVGGHRPWLLEPHRERVHALVAATPHLTVDRLQEQLARDGITVCRDTVWRFLRREGLRFKKNAVRPRTNAHGDGPQSVPVAGAPAPAGVRGRDLDQDQHGAAAGLGAEGASPEGLRTARALANPDLPGRPAPQRAERAVRVRRADQPALLPGLGRAAPGADAPARRPRHPRQPRQPQASMSRVKR